MNLPVRMTKWTRCAWRGLRGPCGAVLLLGKRGVDEE
jgi:hypothetical protein